MKKEIVKILKKNTFIYSLSRKIYSTFQDYYDLLKWKIQNNPPPPHLVKRKTVEKYGDNFSLGILIETGTYRGDMIQFQVNNFSDIYSIELDDNLYLQAEENFSEYSSVNLFHGDSGKVLPQILESISEPCLFWLDAHYSGGVTAKGDKQSPIREELSAILKHPISEHVILIDDARAFTKKGDYLGQEEYPTLRELREVVRSYNPGKKLCVKDDIIRIHNDS